ncbi:MAG: DNA translocase FtsK, partial [Halobacteriovoraceae bacterium]|nr:DNA translocase FtsK [Halobacteriovoraceae bacterium]
MVDKILRLQVVFLFLVTLLAFVAYYYQDSLYDNYLSISSDKGFSHAFLNSLSYIFFSILSLVGYLTGPWLFAPFIIFVLLFAFCYGKRSSWIDTFNICWILGACLCLGILFSPRMVGDGLVYLIDRRFLSFELSILVCFFIVALLAGSLQKKFFTGCRFLFMKTWDLLWRRLFLKFINSKKKEIVRPVKPISTEKSFMRRSMSPGSSQIKKEMTKPRPLETTEKKPPAVGYHDLVVLPTRGPQVREDRPDKSYFEKIINQLEKKLQEFKIEGRITNILKGPVVDTFELELGPGVKVSRLISICEDLSLALYGIPLRIVYPMKGHSTVGVEVPRIPRELIYLEDVLETKEFKSSLHYLPLAMGKDAFGEVLVVDLASMPHMLIAGATGAGKSVFLNALLVSLLVKKSPEQMKLLLIDPK